MPFAGKREMVSCGVRRLEDSELYSEELGINLGRRRDTDYFRWFLASILFGGCQRAVKFPHLWAFNFP
jgi:hypothetical protein